MSEGDFDADVLGGGGLTGEGVFVEALAEGDGHAVGGAPTGEPHAERADHIASADAELGGGPRGGSPDHPSGPEAPRSQRAGGEGGLAKVASGKAPGHPSRSEDRRSQEDGAPTGEPAVTSAPAERLGVARVRCLDQVRARGFTFGRGKVVEGVPLAHAEYLAGAGKAEILEVS